jgi:hypothetical protein
MRVKMEFGIGLALLSASCVEKVESPMSGRGEQ